MVLGMKRTLREGDLGKEGLSSQVIGAEGGHPGTEATAQGTRLLPSSSMWPSSSGLLDEPHLRAPSKSRQGEGKMAKGKS